MISKTFSVWQFRCWADSMATRQNTREVAKKLCEHQIDPDSTVAGEMLQEIAERVLKDTVQEDKTDPFIHRRSTAA